MPLILTPEAQRVLAKSNREIISDEMRKLARKLRRQGKLK